MNTLAVAKWFRIFFFSHSNNLIFQSLFKEVKTCRGEIIPGAERHTGMQNEAPGCPAHILL
jgi:hypothetical protein